MKRIFYFLPLLVLILFTGSHAHGQGGVWTWMHGSGAGSTSGDYGVKGVASPTNDPPERYQTAYWTDKQGNFWIFGGVADFFDEYKFDESKMEMFTTHLAMATQRTVDQNEEFEFDETIWTQIELDPKFEKASSLYTLISNHSPVSYMESERKFLIMHLCNLCQD